MSGAQRARETVAALYPDGVLPKGEGMRLARALGLSRGHNHHTVYDAALAIRAEQATPHREPHETPWLSEYRRGYLDGVLAQQRLVIVQIEPPPGASE